MTDSRRNLKYYLLYALIFWTSVSPYLGRDGKGFGVMLLCFSCIIIFASEIRDVIRCNYAVTVYFFFALYMSVNGVIKDTPMTPFDLLRLFYPIVVMIMTVICMRENPKRLWFQLVLVLILTVVISLIFEGESAEEGRIGSVRNANDIGITCAIGIILILYSLFFNWIHLHTAVICVIPFVLAILKTASRSALGMLAIATVGYILLKANLRNKHFMLALLAASVLVVLATPIMKSTTMAQRVEMTSDQIEGSFQETGTVFDKLGDRGVPYVQSVPLFLENPITGIGIRNWINYSPINQVFHSEYLTHYCENGIIGALFYLTFILMLVVPLLKRIHESGKRGKRYLILNLFMLFVILFLNFVSWTFDRFDVFVLYGIIMQASEKKVHHFNPTQW